MVAPLPHAVLHVHFLRLVARECGKQLDMAGVGSGGEAVAVQEVLGLVPAAEEEDVAPGRGGRDALVDVGDERGDACAGPDHNHRPRRIGREAEAVVPGHENGDALVGGDGDAVAEECGRDALALCVVRAVAQDVCGDCDAGGRHGRGARDGVVPGGEWAEEAGDLRRAEAGADEVAEHVDDVAGLRVRAALVGELGGAAVARGAGEEAGGEGALARVGRGQGEGLDDVGADDAEVEAGGEGCGEGDGRAHGAAVALGGDDGLVARRGERAEHALDGAGVVVGEDA